jgi:hypothetical protein
MTKQIISPLAGFTIFIAFVLALCSFTVSYTTLTELAMLHNIHPPSLFPLIIDGVLLVALVYRLTNINVFWAQIIMGAYVLSSIAFNAIAHGEPLGAIMAAVAPISLLVTSEMCASIITPTKTDSKKKSPKRDIHGRFIKQQ